MANVGAVISNIRNIMRQDKGISGDAQRLEQLGWMLFLKILDDKDQELEVIRENYVSVIPEKFQWRNWATNSEGITGTELLNFIDNNSETNPGLIATLRTLSQRNPSKRAKLVTEVFDGNNNYMKSGYEMRKVINKLNEIDFTRSEDKHVFGTIYESILEELRDAGNKGEYYTPRAVTQLMTMMTDPKLGDKVLDPACGTGGFLTAAIDHVREKYVHTVEDEQKLQASITGWELKPVAYVLGLTNMILHEIDDPDYHYIDSLKREYNSIGRKDQVDVILANPPFGASIADGVETNFPSTFRCKESADLFVVLMIRMLKEHGRGAIVLPDGSITGEGVKARIREELLTKCNVHTIVRMPPSTFFPATVSTNLLFFEKGTPTKEIWYYEHRLSDGQKSYSKTKPIQFQEFDPLVSWWNDRKETEVAWKVKAKDLKNWDLDVKNPFIDAINFGDSLSLRSRFFECVSTTKSIFSELVREIEDVERGTVLVEDYDAFLRNSANIQLLRNFIMKKAIEGKVTRVWREQNKNSETGQQVLTASRKIRKNLIELKELREGKALNPIDKKEIPFDLPASWTWCRLGELGTIMRGKSPDYLANTSKVILNQKCIRWFFVETNHAKTVSEDWEGRFGGEYRTREGDVLVNSTGDGTIGRSAIVDKKASEVLFDSHILRFRPFIVPQYCCILINSAFGQKQVEDLKGAKSTKQTELGVGNLSNFLFSLPPIAEQEEIAKRVNYFLSRCDLLEEHIGLYDELAASYIVSILKNQ